MHHARQGFGLGAEGTVSRDLWVTAQDVLVELAPEQLVDPGLHARTATVEFAPVAGQCTVQALARRYHAGGQVRRKLAGTRFGRQVTQLLVVINGFVEKAGQPPLRLRFTRWPVFTQGAGGCFKTVHVLRNRVGRDVQRCLPLNPVGQRGQAAMQVLQAGFLELAENLKIIATAGEDGARAEEQLVEVAVCLNARLF